MAPPEHLSTKATSFRIDIRLRLSTGSLDQLDTALPAARTYCSRVGALVSEFKDRMGCTLKEPHGSGSLT